MKTIRNWIAIGIVEAIFCFWLLGTAANLVSAPSNVKVWLGIGGYLVGFLLPGASAVGAISKVRAAKIQHQQLTQVFPDTDTSWIQLLDLKE